MVNERCEECKVGTMQQVVDTYRSEFRDENGNIRELPVQNLTWYRCTDCGEEIFDAHAIKQIDDAKREALGLMTAAQIAALRHKLKKNQREMSELLGIGEKTYCRWERGAFQSEAFDRYMRVLDECPNSVLALKRIAARKSGTPQPELAQPKFRFLAATTLQLIAVNVNPFVRELEESQLLAGG